MLGCEVMLSREGFFVVVWEQSKLPAVLRVYRDTLNTDIKAAIRTVVAELLPVLFTRAPDGDLPSADRQADMEGV
jgi:vacuolar protein sorting-associated protein 54